MSVFAEIVKRSLTMVDEPPMCIIRKMSLGVDIFQVAHFWHCPVVPSWGRTNNARTTETGVKNLLGLGSYGRLFVPICVLGRRRGGGSLVQ